MKTITVANQKGGVGKSSVCCHASGALAEKGHKVLIVDMDAQGSISSIFTDGIPNLRYTVFDLLTADTDCEIHDVIKFSQIENISIIPSNKALKHLDTKLAGEIDALYLLQEALEPILDDYDFIFIDCPPKLDLATRMALVAADGVIIPVECHDFAFMGTTEMIDEINRIKKRLNPELKILGFVINKYDARRTIEQNYNEVLRANFKDLIFKTEFHDNVEYVEAAAKRLPITHFRPHSEQAEAYREFVAEINPLDTDNNGQ